MDILHEKMNLLAKYIFDQPAERRDLAEEIKKANFHNIVREKILNALNWILGGQKTPLIRNLKRHYCIPKIKRWWWITMGKKSQK